MKQLLFAIAVLIFTISDTSEAAIINWDFKFEVTNMRSDYPQPAEIGDIFEGSLSYSYSGQANYLGMTANFVLDYLFIDIPLLSSSEWLAYDHKSLSLYYDYDDNSGRFDTFVASWFDIPDSMGNYIYGESINLLHTFEANEADVTDFTEPFDEWHLIPLSSIVVGYIRHIEDTAPIDISGVATEFNLRTVEVSEPHFMTIVFILLLILIKSTKQHSMSSAIALTKSS
ncbi:hypothetical protein HR060_16020 [Catenovulum sp. SM1970]|uniref:hypothetical protein n=1 Tax=Marinifaba aquimaris TaxID=2741323 RepID=UPI00157313A2|nr:hypothetical protein [Marinifaba aquimaris]NTS78360.1 hypothetical protein [Marinifaba aquimaris]